MPKKLISLFAAVFFSSQAIAGGAAGRATEVTQIANNIELLTITFQQAQELVIKINQYETMLRNLQNLDPREISKILGRVVDASALDEEKKRLAKAALEIGKMMESTSKLKNDYESLLIASERMKVTPDQFLDFALNNRNEQRVYFQVHAQQAMHHADTLARDIDSFKRIADQIPQNDGVVQAVGNLTQSSIAAGRIASDTKALLAQLVQMHADERQHALAYPTAEIQKIQAERTTKAFSR